MEGSSSVAGRIVGRRLLAGVLVALGACGPLAAQELCPCPPAAPPTPLWTGSVGLSYLSTSGNTDTESLGFATAWARQPTPWGMEVAATVHRAESEGVTTAERYLGGVRGKRAIGDRHELFGGLSYESNELGGFDSRVIVEAGALWKAFSTSTQELALDGGLTWTAEDAVVGEREDFLGALLGVAYAWKISATATFRERLVFYPNFDTSDDWRIRSEASLEAALADAWALRVGFLVSRDNLPPPGFEKTDSATSVSLVFKR